MFNLFICFLIIHSCLLFYYMRFILLILWIVTLESRELCISLKNAVQYLLLSKITINHGKITFNDETSLASTNYYFRLYTFSEFFRLLIMRLATYKLQAIWNLEISDENILTNVIKWPKNNIPFFFPPQDSFIRVINLVKGKLV